MSVVVDVGDLELRMPCRYDDRFLRMAVETFSECSDLDALGGP